MKSACYSLAMLGFGGTVRLVAPWLPLLFAQEAPSSGKLSWKEQLAELHLFKGTVELDRKNYECAMKEFLPAREAGKTAAYFRGEDDKFVSKKPGAVQLTGRYVYTDRKRSHMTF